MKIKRKIIEIDEELCDGCGNCVPGCAEAALQVVDGKARLVKEIYCDGLGACLGECPTGALRLVEREAEDFDEKAVEIRLEEMKKQEAETTSQKACGCPSAGIQFFIPKAAAGKSEETASALSHWPIQIRLIPPNAPFLKNADLLVLADCAAVAASGLHTDFLRNRVVMMGCPKFDDAPSYVQKFAEIFKTAGIRSITTVYMEVPCCSGLPLIVKKGLAEAGADIPLEEIVITRTGEQEKR